MSENSPRDSRETASSHRHRAFYTILYGGLVVGILDLLFAFTFSGLILGAKPLRIFQASRAIGQRGTLPRLPILLTEVIGHALLVGLPLALLARRSFLTTASKTSNDEDPDAHHSKYANSEANQ